jgi:hypothetical protein
MVPMLAAGQTLAAGVAVGFVIRRPHRTLDGRTTDSGLMFCANFGAELRIGNGPGLMGPGEYLHPTQNVYQMRLYRQMGEVAHVTARAPGDRFHSGDYPRFMVLA